MKKIIFFLSIGCAFYLNAQVVMENFDSLQNIKLNKADKAVISIEPAEGYVGKGMKINFDLTKDHFVEILKPMTIDLKKVKEFVWYVKGDDANGMTMELKLADAKGSTFGKKIPLSGFEKDKWKKIVLPINRAHFMWGPDVSLDKITTWYIAISRGQIKAGSLLIDEFGYTEVSADNPDADIEINQVGYHPTDKKGFVVRIKGLDRPTKISGTFKVINTNTHIEVYSGNVSQTSFTDWKGVFLTGDFSALQGSGVYKIVLTLQLPAKSICQTSFPFEINSIVLGSKTLMQEFEYLDYEKCGVKCHTQDPVVGGYHDTQFDISKRMWSLPSMIYGFARYVKDGQVHPEQDGKASKDMDHLIWGTKFLANVAEPDGTVSWGGVEDDFEKSMSYGEFLVRLGSVNAEDDHLPRVKYKDKNFHATAYNIVALLNAASVLKDQEKGLAVQAENVGKTAWDWLDKQNMKEARDFGAYLWASTELFKYTGDEKYLYRVNEVVPRLLKLQALNFNQFENKACGDFYTSPADKDFRYQYKYVSYNNAINLGLINLAEILNRDDALWFRVYYANYVYGENYLKQIASKTPYKQMAVGLEADQPEKGDANDEFKWNTQVNNNATLAYAVEKGNKVKVLKMDVDLEKGDWAQVCRSGKNNFTGVVKFRYKYKYLGPDNNLEFKLMDNFGYKKKLKNTPDWTEEEISYSDFRYMWDQNRKVDLANVPGLWFTITKGTGGKALFYVKEVEWINEKGESKMLSLDDKPSSAELFFKFNYFAGKEAERSAAANHGLNCDHLGRGYVAMRWGQYINDLELEEFADNQMNWVLGANPLGYCMLIGAGSREPDVMADNYPKVKLNGVIPNGIVGALNDEPEWWGDVPSSGEDWLPHNAAYFTILSLLDSPAQIQGTVLNRTKPVANALISIMKNMKKSSNIIVLHTDDKGHFGPVSLPPQEKYSLVIEKDKRKVVKDLSVLSGEKEDVTIDLVRDYTIQIQMPSYFEKEKQGAVSIQFSKNAVGQPYKVRMIGCQTSDLLEGIISGSSLKMNIIPDGDKPILFRVEIPGNPVVCKEMYIKAF